MPFPTHLVLDLTRLLHLANAMLVNMTQSKAWMCVIGIAGWHSRQHCEKRTMAQIATSPKRLRDTWNEFDPTVKPNPVEPRVD